MLSGSQPSEANHSSVCSHLGSGCAQPLHDEINKLFSRKREQVAQKETARKRYRLHCVARTIRNSDGWEDDKKDALLTLSKKSHGIFVTIVKDAENYSCRQLLESARRIPNSERCPCPNRIALCVQCVHEYCAAGRLFRKDLWSMRHWQRDALPATAVGSSMYSQLEAEVYTDEGGTQAVAADSDVASAGEEEEDDNFPMNNVDDGDDNDNNPPTELDGHGRGLVDTAEVSAVPYKEMAQKVCELLDAGNGLDPKWMNLFYGNICEVLSAVRDETGIYQRNVSTASGVKGSSQVLRGAATISKAASDKSVSQAPRGAKTRRAGAPSTLRKASKATTIMTRASQSKKGGCGFCGQAGHNMIGCVAKLEHGKHLTNSQLNELLIGDLARASKAMELPQGIVTMNAPILKSLPKTSSSTWMVIHGQFFFDPKIAGKLDIANLRLLVTILGKFGDPLQVRRVVTYATASAWMYQSMPKGGAYKENSCSQVFSDMDMEASVRVPGNEMAPFFRGRHDNHNTGQSFLGSLPPMITDV